MHLHLPATAMLLAFALASLVLAVIPGPGVLYIVTRTLAQGRRAGLTSVAGVALGNLGNAVAAAVGLAALFAMSAMAFTVVKMAGAAYLIYLGLNALRAPRGIQGDPALTQVAPRRIFRDGFVVSLLNPKTTLFFAAFLPQFINPLGSAVLQGVALGAAFVLIAAATDSLYALGAAAIAPRLAARRRGPGWGRYLTASIYIGLGVFTALSGQRSAA